LTSFQNTWIRIILFFFIFVTKTWAFGDKIVRINADIDDTVSSGTGFFWESDGTVLTAYHVIKGATQIRIYSGGQLFDQIMLVSYSNEYDLALLKILDFNNYSKIELFNLGYSDSIYQNLNQSLDIVAYPWGWAEYHKVTGRPTRSKLIWSETITNREGYGLFARNIQVILMDVTVYGGMSGAPVVMNDKVVGVLSGSLEEGGSLAWAIPVKYAKDKMKIVNVLPDEFDWPELTLMNKSTWRSLNFEKTRPAKEFNVKFGLLTNAKGDAYNISLIFLYNSYSHNLNYGFELGVLSHFNVISYETLSGFDEQRKKEHELRFFPNLFISKEYYNFERKPYYGVSLGFPFNAQLRMGMKFFSKFNLEIRTLYFLSTSTSFEFNNFGDSIEVQAKVVKFQLFFGLNIEY